ncbi:MAG: GNAT family N-acetyltransferase [Chloroflexi bacterium]|nr:GNAT family N-acetyltransferase [Chloroflexota bacterium]
MTVADDVRLEGELVLLRPRVDEDLALFARWHGNPDVRHWLHMSETPTQTLELERQRWQVARNDPARISFVIETLDGVPVGNIALIGVDATHRRAELGIAIGEKGDWGRGYGTDAIRVILRYAFEVLNLRRVELITDIDNERGIRAYEKCGFVREGVLRAKRMRYGEPLDMLIMAVLRED